MGLILDDTFEPTGQPRIQNPTHPWGPIAQLEVEVVLLTYIVA
jgi:hypothetical protein